MRISKQQVAGNRAEVLNQAARLFRERGLEGPSVAELMKAAGLTHGGFYNHFASKAALQTDAVALTFEQAVERVGAVAAQERGPARLAALRAYVEAYLSPKARDAAGARCPMVAFGADVSRESADVQRAYAEGLERYLLLLAEAWSQEAAEKQPDETPADARARAEAVSLLVSLVGGLSLARSLAHANPKLSDDILDRTREELIRRLDHNAPELPARR